MNIYELETNNGRVFRVSIDNDAQLARLNRAIKTKDGGYEAFKRCEVVLNGIHDIKSFENLVQTLQ